MKFKNRSIINIAFLLACSLQVAGQAQTNDRAGWFVDARFGMFIHWGVYSGAEGVWKGEKLRYDNGYAEWIQYRNRISEEEYLSLLDGFDWDKIDPEEWVILAKKAGMKYVTITAKHHDGFALWDSKIGEYDIADKSPERRDIIRELADACKKHDIKLGLYYSHWVDWQHPYGWDHTKEVYPISDKQYDLYWQEKVIPQMRELLTNYGDIGLIWFDMWIHHSETIVSKEQLQQLKSLIRALQPDCLINSRLGLSVEEDRDVDFQTLGDNQLGSEKSDHPFQTSATVAHSWGYHALDTEWKSTTKLLMSLIGNVSLNGNFMLNIGPRANGEIPFEINQRLEEIGQWLQKYGESIYGAGAFDLPVDMHDWGRITYKELSNKRHKLYLHINNWPLNNQIKLTGISSKPVHAYMLLDDKKTSIQTTFNEVVLDINLNRSFKDPRISVIVLEYNEIPQVVPQLVAKSTSGGYSLTPINMKEKDMIIQRASRFGSVPAYISGDTSQSFSWKIYVEAPEKMALDVSYSYQGADGKSSIRVTGANESLNARVFNTGKTVGEPRSDWVIDSFESNRLGVMEFPKAGFYDLSIDINASGKNPILFQWIWLQPQK